MQTSRINFRSTATNSPDNLSELSTLLTQLIGEPFRFSRVSYGDELTLHFGDLRPARSAKLKAHLYGAYILGLRASPWFLKSGSDPMAIITAGVNPDTSPMGNPMTKEQIEADPLIRRGSHVVAVTPFLFKQSDAIDAIDPAANAQYVLIRAELYDRLRALDSKGWGSAAAAAAMEVFARDGWDDPRMDVYDSPAPGEPR